MVLQLQNLTLLQYEEQQHKLVADYEAKIQGLQEALRQSTERSSKVRTFHER